MKVNSFKKFLQSSTLSFRKPTSRTDPKVHFIQPTSYSDCSMNPINEAFENQSTQKVVANTKIIDPGSYISIFLTELDDLRDEDLPPGRECNRDTTFVQDSSLTDHDRPFQLDFGHLSFSKVPFCELVEEFKFLRVINNRKELPDNILRREIIYLIQSFPEVDKPNKLFKFLKLRTCLSHFEDPRTNRPVPSPPPHFESFSADLDQDDLYEIYNAYDDKPEKANTIFNHNSIEKNLICLARMNEPYNEYTAQSNINMHHLTSFHVNQTNPTANQEGFHTNQTGNFTANQDPSNTLHAINACQNDTEYYYSQLFMKLYCGFINLGLTHDDALKYANKQIDQQKLRTSQIQTPSSQFSPLNQPIFQASRQQFLLPSLLPTQPLQPTTFTAQPTAPDRNITLTDQTVKEQKMAMMLIATVPTFSGKGAPRFETWIKHFDTQLDTADFKEEKKIKLLLSKLTNDALECALGFKERNPISAKVYENVKNCLFQRFHGNETRIQYVTEFQNCTRLAGESLRDFACRLQKLFAHAYPMMKGVPTGPEVLLMDKFICGLPRKLQNLLKHKEYPSFEELIKKAEARLACDDDQFDDTIPNINAVSAYQTQPIVHSVQPSPNDAGHKVVLDAIEQLCSVMQQNMSLQTDELQKNLRQSEQGNSKKQVVLSGQNRSQPTRKYCEFHNCWTTHDTSSCWMKEVQKQYICEICNEKGHGQYYCPTQRSKSMPNSPTQSRSNSRHNSPSQRRKFRPSSPTERPYRETYWAEKRTL